MDKIEQSNDVLVKMAQTVVADQYKITTRTHMIAEYTK